MPQDRDNSQITRIIESSLELTGKGSKQVILDYLKVRYGMNIKLILEYRDEFKNYLRETLGDSAEMIISRVDAGLDEFTGSKNDGAKTTRVQEQKRPSRGRRITDVIHFLICDNCFWCASILGERHESRCLSCGSRIVSAVPVTNNERFVVEVDKKRGISLSFR